MAWEKEKAFVESGVGTRDWSISQQMDILEYGKAYDEDGKAFEGHHMKSVEKYPEYQADSRNIQFLTRKEHQAAHGGSFQNPTNGRYIPATGETIEFVEVGFDSNELIKLSNPYCIKSDSDKLLKEKDVNIEEYERQIRDKTYKTHKTNKKDKTDIALEKNFEIKKEINQISRKKEKKGIISKARDFVVDNDLAQPIIDFISDVAASAVSNQLNRKKYVNDNENNRTSLLKPDIIDEKEYTPNDVPAGRQRYHYKDGSVKWKDKPAYHRGGKKDEQK